MNKIIERLQGIDYTAQTNSATLTGDDIAFVTQSVKATMRKSLRRHIPLSAISEVTGRKKLCTS